MKQLPRQLAANQAATTGPHDSLFTPLTPMAQQFRTGPNELFFKGERARYTGKVEVLYGATFYEIEILEGHRKGEMALVSDRQNPKLIKRI